MSEAHSSSRPSSERPRRSRFNEGSITVRFGVVVALVVASMIPLGLVTCTVVDRVGYRNEAVRDIAHSWGEEQRIVGPVIFIPLDERGRGPGEEDRVAVVSERVDIRILDDSAGGHREGYVAVMPARIDTRIETSHEIRRRGIFDVAAFSMEIAAEGEFAPLDVTDLQHRFGALRLDLAFVGIGISDPRGIREAALTWRDREVGLSAASGTGPVEKGLTGELGDKATRGGVFSVALDLRGTGRFSAVPVGDRSTLDMKSSWPHPSFDGRLLPDTHDIDSSGFSASWTTGELGRGFPSVMQISSLDGFRDKDLGFTVFDPIDLYGLIERSVKYGLLFVVLTLVSVLCLELTTGIRFHFVQYGVTSIALVLFFLTLLALAEHIGFTLGYVVAAVVLAGMVGWYANGSTGNHRLAGAAFGSLGILYSVLYVILRLESFALLVGTVVLLAALAMLMRVTRGLTPTAEAVAPD